MGLTVIWDNATVMSRQSQRRASTPYLRGTIQGGDGELAKLIGSRCIAWGDVEPVEQLAGKLTLVVGRLRDEVEVEAQASDDRGQLNQKTFTLANITVTKYFSEEEKAAAMGATMLADLKNLETRGPRVVKRTADPTLTERRIGGELGSPAQGTAGEVAHEALHGGGTAPAPAAPANPPAQAGGAGPVSF